MRYLFVVISFLFLQVGYANSHLVQTIKAIKPAVVGVGVYTPLGRPQNKLYGSGFVIGDGSYVVTNHHVVARELDNEKRQQLTVFIGTGNKVNQRNAQLIAADQRVDLAVLKIAGKPLPAVSLSDGQFLPEGTDIAFTGFPIGSVLGLYPVTHKGIISAITPTVIPVDDTKQLSIKVLKQLRNPYMVYQLDATAYPGNSGSAMFEPATGEVIGVINKVFVQSTKEAVLNKPSGITYAIPVNYLHQLLKKHNIKL